MTTKSINDLKISEFKKDFCKLQNNNYFGRLGKTFKTNKNFYFIDTGTGKVARVNKNVYEVLKCLLENNKFEALTELNISTDDLIVALDEIKSSVEKEHILSAPILETLTGDSVLKLDELLADSISTITLELTEKCNLRCKYCVYNPSHPNYRKFGHKDMKFETAKKAIDFLYAHSKKKKDVYIGFYGGEPLINYKLIKKCVDYSKEILKDKKITYAMTTNATLITDEIANFLVENKVAVTISCDGPKDVHDENRVYVNGKGSFDDLEIGVKKLIKAYKKFNERPSFGFNIVTSGPNYEEKYEKIYEFLKKSNWIPKNIPISCSIADMGPEEAEYVLPQSTDEKEYVETISEPLAKWSSEKKKSVNNEQLFSQGDFNKRLLRIHKRLLLDEPTKEYGMNGCCVPGMRRVYVAVNGDLYPCERVGESPSLGNLDSGFDIPKIKKVYVEDYINEAKKFCKNCWAVNLCGLCYTSCLDKNGIKYEYRNKECINQRNSIENDLVGYHSLLETNPNKLNELNKVEMC